MLLSSIFLYGTHDLPCVISGLLLGKCGVAAVGGGEVGGGEGQGWGDDGGGDGGWNGECGLCLSGLVKWSVSWQEAGERDDVGDGARVGAGKHT